MAASVAAAGVLVVVIPGTAPPAVAADTGASSPAPLAPPVMAAIAAAFGAVGWAGLECQYNGQCPNFCHAPLGRGACDAETQLCACSAGWAGLDCGTPLSTQAKPRRSRPSPQGTTGAWRAALVPAGRAR